MPSLGTIAKLPLKAHNSTRNRETFCLHPVSNLREDRFRVRVHRPGKGSAIECASGGPAKSLSGSPEPGGPERPNSVRLGQRPFLGPGRSRARDGAAIWLRRGLRLAGVVLLCPGL